MQFASWKERKAIAKAIKPIYAALSADLAITALKEFEQGDWGRKYPLIVDNGGRYQQVVEQIVKA